MEFEAILEINFQIYLEELRKHYSGDLYGYSYSHIVLMDGKVVGSLMDLADLTIREYGIEDAEIANTMQFQREAKEKSTEAIKSTGHPVVFLDLFQAPANAGDDEIPVGRVVIELLENICPEACDNFIKLCTGSCGSDGDVKLSYKDCPLHRLVPNGWLQTGDIVDGSGANSRSASGNPIRDESFSIEFDSPIGGIVGYASSGPHSNGSQFFITLGTCEWMNCTKVGFGRVIEGYTTLFKLNSSCCRNQRPNPAIFIGDCGLVK